jgi:hypothetical protein
MSPAARGLGQQADFESCCMATLQWEMVPQLRLDGAHDAG